MSFTTKDDGPLVECHECVSRTESIAEIFDLPFDNIIDKYLEKETNPKVVNYLTEFLKVNNWCKKSQPCKSKFDVVSQGGTGDPDGETQSHILLRGHVELRKRLEDDLGPDNKAPCLRAFIAENICPYSICLLGILFDIKPRLWATHFEKTYQTQEEDVDRWLTPLPSTSGDRDLDSVNIQYLEPRELEKTPSPYESMDTIRTLPRPLTHFQNYSNRNSHGKRYALKVNRDVEILPVREQTRTQRTTDEPHVPVAFIPGPLSVWTKASDDKGEPDFMVILIDPSPDGLDVKPNYHLDKKPTGFSEKLTVQRPSERIANSILACSGNNEMDTVTKAYYGIGGMIAKQWQLVLGYTSRDFHRIECKLRDIPDFTVAERMLKDLFRHRQNCEKYCKLLSETGEEFQEWKFKETDPLIYDLNSIRQGLRQLSFKIDRNISLLTDLTAIKEAQQGLQENHGVTRLTQVATIYLPFSTVAAVLAMPNQFAPGANQFWVYWAASAVLAALVILTLLSYQPLLTSFVNMLERRRERSGDEDEKSRIEKRTISWRASQRAQMDEEMGIMGRGEVCEVS